MKSLYRDLQSQVQTTQPSLQRHIRMTVQASGCMYRPAIVFFINKIRNLGVPRVVWLIRKMDKRIFVVFQYSFFFAFFFVFGYAFFSSILPTFHIHIQTFSKAANNKYPFSLTPAENGYLLF